MVKRIDITTTQNVVIDYKAASVFERILAWLIDFVFLAFSLFILWLIITGIFPSTVEETLSYLILIPLALTYHLMSEVFFNGVSLGKLALGLRVVKINNEPVSIYDYVMRWAFRVVDIVSSLGLVAAITISSSPKNQRIGDYLADTTVVKIPRTDRFSLHKITELDSLKNYEPQYPEVTALSEDDMLVIKEVIDRLSATKGKLRSDLLKQTVKQVEDILGISPKTRDVNFLKTLIKDYVALTR